MMRPNILFPFGFLIFLNIFYWGKCQSFQDSNSNNFTLMDTTQFYQLPNLISDPQGGLGGEARRQNTSITANFQNPGKCDVPMNNVTHFQNSSNLSLERVKKPWGTVEVLVVFDKELGDTFNHDRKAIMDYLTMYFWDINMRYKTLPSVSITFRVTGLIVISDFRDQPFIEDARNPERSVNYQSAMKNFNRWLYLKSSSHTFPKYDIAALFSRTEDPGRIAGFANLGGACGVDHERKTQEKGVILYDFGAFSGVIFAAHEIGHTLGSDHDIDPAGCEGIYIMNATATYENPWYFSDCSNRAITNFVRTREASCLRRIDSKRAPLIDPHFSSVKAPDMNEHCRRRLNNPEAYVTESDSQNCNRLRCSFLVGNQVNSEEIILDLDNTICGRDGRCFRGKCRKQGYLLVNIATGKCLSTVDKFNGKSSVILTKCPKPSAGTPLDQFLITDTANGKTLSTPFQAAGPSRGEACLGSQNSIVRTVFADTCDVTKGYQMWEFIDLGGGRGHFLIRHRASGKCMKLKWNKVRVSPCNKYDARMKWKLI